MADVTIPRARQEPGKMMGGVWIVIQAYVVANLWTLALLGEQGARWSAGGPEYDVLERAKRVGMTSYKGRKNMEMTIDMIYDGWITHPIRPQLPGAFMTAPRLPVGIRWSGPGTSAGGAWVENQIRTLDGLCYPRGPGRVPPSVRVYGAAPTRASDRWLVSGLEWGDFLTDRVTGQRMRQQVTVTLLEYQPGEELERLPRGRAKKSAQVRRG